LELDFKIDSIEWSSEVREVREMDKAETVCVSDSAPEDDEEAKEEAKEAEKLLSNRPKPTKNC